MNLNISVAFKIVIDSRVLYSVLTMLKVDIMYTCILKKHLKFVKRIILHPFHFSRLQRQIQEAKEKSKREA